MSLKGLKRQAIAECIRPGKTCAACFLNSFKNEPSYEFISEVIFKLNRLRRKNKREIYREQIFATYKYYTYH